MAGVVKGEVAEEFATQETEEEEAEDDKKGHPGPRGRAGRDVAAAEEDARGEGDLVVGGASAVAHEIQASRDVRVAVVAANHDVEVVLVLGVGARQRGVPPVARRVVRRPGEDDVARGLAEEHVPRVRRSDLAPVPIV